MGDLEASNQEVAEDSSAEILPKPCIIDIGQGYKIDANDIMVPVAGPDKFKFQKLIFVKTEGNSGIFYFPDGAILAKGTFGVRVHNTSDYAQIVIKNGRIFSTLNPQQILIGEGSVDDDTVFLES